MKQDLDFKRLIESHRNITYDLPHVITYYNYSLQILYINTHYKYKHPFMLSPGIASPMLFNIMILAKEKIWQAS